VGRLVASKGHDDLIRAVAIVRGRGHAMRLRIGGRAGAGGIGVFGEGARSWDAVTFLGSLAEDQYQEEMNRADVFVLASHCEPLGVVYMEALATGRR